MTAKPDAFASATYYECLDDTPLTHTTVAEAIEAAIDNAWEGEGDTPDILIAKIAPVEVTAWARKTATDEHVKSLALDAFGALEENADETFGNPEHRNALWTDAEAAGVRFALRLAIRRAMDCASIWQCDVVGKRSYTAVEIAAILTGETT